MTAERTDKIVTIIMIAVMILLPALVIIHNTFIDSNRKPHAKTIYRQFNPEDSNRANR